MKTIVVYSSQYGATEQYARWLAEAQCTFFHLRGRLDYPHLTVVHRAMMAMLRKMLLKKAPSSLREEDRQLLETYGKDVNFIDRSEIEPIVSFVRRGAE